MLQDPTLPWSLHALHQRAVDLLLDALYGQVLEAVEPVERRGRLQLPAYLLMSARQQVGNKRLDMLPRDILRISVHTLQARKIDELVYRLLVVGVYTKQPATKAFSGFRMSGPAVAVCQSATRC